MAKHPRLRALPPLASSLPPLVPSATKQTDADLGTAAHRNWAERVKRRAGYRCEECGATGRAMIADHIEERQDAPHRALDDSNGRCLCAPCHVRKTHRARAARHGA